MLSTFVIYIQIIQYFKKPFAIYRTPLNSIVINTELNNLIEELNQLGNKFIENYFKELKSNSFSQKEEEEILEYAIKTIYADNVVEYSEVKFFKVIRSQLKINDDALFTLYPDLAQYIEDDISSIVSFDKLSKQFLEMTELPKFNSI